MFGPGTYTESEVLVGHLEVQLAAIRAAAYGLTESQARDTPCRSTLSVGGLVKHVTWVMRQLLLRRDGDEAPLDEAGYASFMGGFALTDAETLDGVLHTFDATREEYLADVRAVDPGAATTAPPAPWDGRFEPTPSVRRYELVHHVEEFARHAGHADLVREQLDGADAASLLMAAEGHPGNDYVQPWTPADRPPGD